MLPKNKAIYDVGFNWVAGSKWSNKSWPKKNWEKLKRLLSKKYSVSWQQGLNDLNEYIDWINSCKLFITHDSLGIHIALALKKKIIGLFGPTNPQEVYMHGFGRAVYTRQECHLMPCYAPTCLTGLNCIEHLENDEIIDAVNEVIGTGLESLIK